MIVPGLCSAASVANVPGLANVPPAVATLWIVGLPPFFGKAMALPGGELSGHPYNVTSAFRVLGAAKDVAVRTSKPQDTTAVRFKIENIEMLLFWVATVQTH